MQYIVSDRVFQNTVQRVRGSVLYKFTYLLTYLPLWKLHRRYGGVERHQKLQNVGENQLVIM